MAEVYNKKYKFYKFSKIVLLVVAIPLLALALFSAIVMNTSKEAGGYPSMFGYTVIDLTYDQNAYYGEGVNKKIMVQKVSNDDYKVGDIIVYYVNISGEETDKGGVFHDNNALSYSGIIQNDAMTYGDPVIGVDISAISVGQIGSIGKITETGTNNVHDAFTVYVSESQSTSDQDNAVFAENVLGKMVEASPILVDVLTYCASVQNFIILVLIPLLVVLALQIMNTVARRAYERSERMDEKERIRVQENAQDAPLDQAEPINQYQESLAQTVEGFNQNPGVRRAPPSRPRAQAPVQPAPARAPVQPARAQAPVQPQRARTPVQPAPQPRQAPQPRAVPKAPTASQRPTATSRPAPRAPQTPPTPARPPVRPRQTPPKQ